MQLSRKFTIAQPIKDSPRLIPAPRAPSPRALLRHFHTLLLVAFCVFDLGALSRFADACDALDLWPLAVLLGLALWSLTSEQLPGSGANLRYVLSLLALSAGLRLFCAMAPLPRLHAATLAIEAYAAATLAGVHPRQRAWSSRGTASRAARPSLPTETLLQRSLGYGLQHAQLSRAACATTMC